MAESRLTPEERHDLVAYLDGELPTESRSRLESKIANSVSARQEVDALQRTWEMLDFLPTPKVSSDFTQRTLEVSLRQNPQPMKLSASTVQKLRKVAEIVAIAGLLVGSVFAGRWLAVAIPDKNYRFTRDLHLLEKLAEYQSVGEVEYLRKLHDLKVMDAAGSETP